VVTNSGGIVLVLKAKSPIVRKGILGALFWDSDLGLGDEGESSGSNPSELDKVPAGRDLTI
jgi:hypothetical protein